MTTPPCPWASYFNGGDALHGFVRATYGSPQSNGCVEMAIADRRQGVAAHPDRHAGHRGGPGLVVPAAATP